MKILFTNDAEDATLSMTNESANYPVENIVNQVLRIRSQSTTFETEFTIEFSEDKTIDSLFYGWHNAIELEADFLNSSDSIIYSASAQPIDGIDDNSDVNLLFEDGIKFLFEDDVEFLLDFYGSSVFELRDIGRIYIPSTSGVRKIKIRLVTDESAVYLGGVGTGTIYETIYNVEDGYTDDYEDNSIVYVNQNGQGGSNYIDPLRVKNYILREYTNEQRIAMETLYKSVGVGKRLYFDPFEDNQDYEPAIYGFLTAPISFTKNGRRFSTPIAIQEAR
jgi:hypothetical protein